MNDELQRRINEHVLNGDASSIIWLIEGQIRMNTELEAKVAELERREVLLTELALAERDVRLMNTRRVPSTERSEILGRSDRAMRALKNDGFPWAEEPTK